MPSHNVAYLLRGLGQYKSPDREKLERNHRQGDCSNPDLVWKDGGVTGTYSICDHVLPNRCALL